MSEKKKGIIKEQNHKLKKCSVFLILISLIPLLIAIFDYKSDVCLYDEKLSGKKCRKYVIYCCIEFGKSLQGKMKLQL